jgi:hypothetical protein
VIPPGSSGAARWTREALSALAGGLPAPEGPGGPRAAALRALALAALALDEATAGGLLPPGRPAALSLAGAGCGGRLVALLREAHDGAAGPAPFGRRAGSLIAPGRISPLFPEGTTGERGLLVDDRSLTRALGLLGRARAALPPGAASLGHLYEAMLDASLAGGEGRGGEGRDRVATSTLRRARGAHYTPAPLARRVMDEALSACAGGPCPREPGALRLLDPSSGAGAFLVEAAGALAELVAARPAGQAPAESLRAAREHVVTRCLRAIERDPVSAELSRLSLQLLAPGADPAAVAAAVTEGEALSGLDPLQLETLSLDGLGDRPAAIALRLARGSRDDRRRLSLAADAVVAGALAGLAAGDRAGLRRRAVAACEARAPTAALRADVDRLLAGRTPLHPSLCFPDVMAQGGFDLVVGNPPFGNAVEAATGRSRGEAALYRACFQRAARGAYDISNLFVARAVALLRPGGVFALILPRASLAQRSALALQALVAERAPLVALLAPRSSRLFARTSVYVACAVGRRPFLGEIPPPPRVVIGDGPAAPPLPPRPGAAGEPWWSLLQAPEAGDALYSGNTSALAPLGEHVVAHAGCAAGVAYELSPHVTDDRGGDGALLVTTGLIDRHRVLWGERPARFLGRDYRFPRWPSAGAGAPASVARALARQRGPKVLVAGLSRRLEAWADLAGDAAAVVGVQVLRPASPSLDLRVLAALVSSWAMSQAYMRLFGAKRMGQGNWTVGKRELLSTPFPVAITGSDFQRGALALLDASGAPLDDAADEALQRLVARAFGVEGDAFDRLERWYAGRGDL